MKMITELNQYMKKVLEIRSSYDLTSVSSKVLDELPIKRVFHMV